MQCDGGGTAEEPQTRQCLRGCLSAQLSRLLSWFSRSLRSGEERMEIEQVKISQNSRFFPIFSCFFSLSKCSLAYYKKFVNLKNFETYDLIFFFFFFCQCSCWLCGRGHLQRFFLCSSGNLPLLVLFYIMVDLNIFQTVCDVKRCFIQQGLYSQNIWGNIICKQIKKKKICVFFSFPPLVSAHPRYTVPCLGSDLQPLQ